MLILQWNCSSICCLIFRLESLIYEVFVLCLVIKMYTYNESRLQAKVSTLDHGHPEGLEYSMSVPRLLGQEPGSGEHGETPVLQLPRDHEIELRGIRPLIPRGSNPISPE
jgi:hypothetical protein